MPDYQNLVAGPIFFLIYPLDKEELHTRCKDGAYSIYVSHWISTVLFLLLDPPVSFNFSKALYCDDAQISKPLFSAQEKF